MGISWAGWSPITDDAINSCMRETSPIEVECLIVVRPDRKDRSGKITARTNRSFWSGTISLLLEVAARSSFRLLSYIFKSSRDELFHPQANYKHIS